MARPPRYAKPEASRLDINKACKIR
ncbi:hypothetical protein H4S14_002829 [Agrobacterium vitis]|nr:hypothetical protein [Agrobacterium vitis]MBE1439069.1 hypothetical protein [Agrobacterium vitis]